MSMNRLICFIACLKRNELHSMQNLIGAKSVSVIWAASWQNQQSEYAPSEDSDQPGRPHEETLDP